MRLLPSVKQFIEDNIQLIETEDWEAILELSRIGMPGNNYLRQKVFADTMIEAGFDVIKPTQYKLAEPYIKGALGSYTKDLRAEKYFSMDLFSILSKYLNSTRRYGLTTDEIAEFIIDKKLDNMFGLMLYKNSKYDWIFK